MTSSGGSAPAGVFPPSGAGTTADDADYAGSGTILTAANGTDLLMFYRAGALTPTAIETGGFIYVLYREIDLQSGVSGLAIARALVSGDGAPGTFKKWFGGSFSTPGLGGTTTPLTIVLDPANKDLGQPHVSYNTYLNAYLMGDHGERRHLRPIVIPGQASDQVSAQTGFLYDAKSTGANSQHFMYRQAFALSGS